MTRRKSRDYMRGVGAVCKAWRKEHGYLQKEIAVELGTSPQVVCMYEAGRINSVDILAWYLRHGMPVAALNLVRWNDEH